MVYRRDLWEVAAGCHGVVTVQSAEDAGVPAVEVRKLAARGALRRAGYGVYLHRDVPATPWTQPALAVALAGRDAYLYGEAVLALYDLGNVNPKAIRVATERRVRRTLPEWVSLEHRVDIQWADLTTHHSIRGTTVACALHEVRARTPVDRWTPMVDQAMRRDLLDENDAAALRAA
jgi:predicted transcriptional regulator of viral defense system